MNKNIIIIILVLVLLGLAGFTYYLYSGATECKTKALECKTIATDYGTKLQLCAGALTSLKQVPACAPYFPAE